MITHEGNTSQNYNEGVVGKIGEGIQIVQIPVYKISHRNVMCSIAI